MKYKNLKSRAVKVSDITPKQTLQMWNLFHQYYADVNLEMFLNDLAQKTHVVMLFRHGEVLGFSTAQLYDTKVDGKTVRVLYSGDTIKHRDVWGEKTMNKTFAKMLAKDYFLNLNKEYYWFLISKGYKTYLLLTNNFPNSWPRHDQDFPTFEKKLVDHLAIQKFGESYLPEKGLLIFQESKGRLKEDTAPVTAEDLKIQHIKYFMSRNPQYLQGQELCCLAKIDTALWKRTVQKLFLPRRKKQIRVETEAEVAVSTNQAAEAHT